MLKGIFQNKSNSTKLSILFLIMIFGYLLFQVFIALFMPESVVSQKWAQGFFQISCFLLPGLLFAKLDSNNIFRYLGLRSSINRQMTLLVLCIMIFILPLIVYSSHLNKEIIFALSDFFPNMVNNFEGKEEIINNTIKEFLIMENELHLVINLLLMAFLPSICEEIIFRGIIQKKFELISNPHIAIIITSIVFSAIHMQFISFLPRMFLGVLLGYLFYYSKNLWMPIIAHFVNNSIAILGSYFIIDSRNENINNSEINISVVFLSAVVVIMFFYLYVRISKMND